MNWSVLPCIGGSNTLTLRCRRDCVARCSLPRTRTWPRRPPRFVNSGSKRVKRVGDPALAAGSVKLNEDERQIHLYMVADKDSTLVVRMPLSEYYPPRILE